MHELIIATTNQGKLREIRELLKDLDVKITSLSDYPDAPKVEEDGKNFAQNALKKAATIALYTGKLTLGEDSGLEVKALGNKPGIYSSRFAGNGATDKKNNAKLLRELRGVPLKKRQACLSGRQARYRCFAALVDGGAPRIEACGPVHCGIPRGGIPTGTPSIPHLKMGSFRRRGKGVIDVVSGSCAGVIALKGKGNNGFGYDPLFFIPRYHKTFGELEPAIKAKISHRARALGKVKKVLQQYIG